MKKRLLSALLALALVFVLLPTTALAGETTGSDYDISINGTGWKFETDDSGACIPVYYYADYKFNTEEGYGFRTDDNLMLTKEGNTVTISFRRGTGNKFYSNPVDFTIKSGENNKSTPCIEMGNGNNLVITGEGTKGTLELTHDTPNGIGAALSSKVGNITITGGATVKVTFKKQSTPNVSGHAISVDNHDLIISGVGTTVEATNQSGASQGFSNDATVMVKNGRIDVSGGAWLKATNEFTNTSKLYPPDFKNFSYYSSAISGDKYAPCTVSVTGEKSRITASAHNSTGSMGQAYRWANFDVDGAKIEVGNSSYPLTGSTVDDIKGYRYVTISVPTAPAPQRTSDVLIAKENAVVGVETSIPSANGSGTYYYDQASKTLTLNNVTITSGTNAIQFAAAGTYTVKLEGTNKISNVSNGISVTDDKYITSLNVTITGTGSLDISAKGLAINMKKGDLKFENTGEIKLTTSNISPTHNVLSVSGNITIADMEKYKVEGIVQDNTKDGGDTVTLSEASHLKGYQNPDGTAICLKTITITPTPAKDSTIRYNGTTLKQGETIRNGGTATVDSKNNTITLKNFNGTAALSFEATLADSTLVLEGTNTLSSIVTTQKGLTISGSGSLTVGSIKVTNNDNIRADLTITDGAKVTAGTTTSDAKAIDITGNLTVNSGATLTATNASETKPTIDVTGNVTISGNPGTNAYTVSAHNSYNVQKDRDGHLSPSGVPSAIKIGGTLNISAGARVMAQTDSYGAGVMLGQNSTITVEDAFLSAKNSSCDFAAISFSGQTGKIDVSGAKGEVVAENTHAKTNLVYRAINAFVYNSNTDFYLKMQSEGVINEAVNKIIAPGGHNASGGKKVTITRGDEVTRTNSPVVIDGHTLLNDTYYTINGSTVAEGSKNNYNAFYDSKTKTLKLNNAQISTTTNNAAIKISEDLTITVTGTNELKGNYNHCIESDNNFKINGTGTLVMTNGSNTAASVIYCGPYKNLTIAAEVIIKNEAQPGYLIHIDKKDAYSFAEGYNVYASTDVSSSPLEVYNPENYGTYKYLRVTKETLETGGGSTHEHVWDEAWHDTGDGHHAHQCTKCQAFDTAHQQAHDRLPDESKGLDKGHTLKCGLCGYKYDQSIIESHVWSGWETFEQYFQLGDHAQRCNCGQLGYRHLKGELVYRPLDSEYHQQICSVEGCGYPGRISKSEHVYEENSDICKYCEYDKSAPCDHTGDRAYTNNGDGTHKVTCIACGATIVEKQNHEFNPTGVCIYCGATQSGGDPTPDNPGTIVIIRPAEEEKPAQQPNPSTGANDLVGLAVAAAVAAALGSAALLRKHD